MKSSLLYPLGLIIGPKGNYVYLSEVQKGTYMFLGTTISFKC